MKYRKNMYVYTFAFVHRRQLGQVVSASDSQSSGSGFESRSHLWFHLYHHDSEFKSSTTLVNSQLVRLRPVGMLCSIWIIWDVFCDLSETKWTLFYLFLYILLTIHHSSSSIFYLPYTIVGAIVWYLLQKSYFTDFQWQGKKILTCLNFEFWKCFLLNSEQFWTN